MRRILGGLAAAILLLPACTGEATTRAHESTMLTTPPTPLATTAMQPPISPSPESTVKTTAAPTAQPTRPAGRTRTRTNTAEVVWRSGGRPVSPLVKTGKHIGAVYIDLDHQLHLRGISLRDGSVLWTLPASGVGDMNTVRIAPIGRFVAFVPYNGGSTTRTIGIVDTSTGRIIARTRDSHDVEYMPSPCGKKSKEFCFTTPDNLHDGWRLALDGTIRRGDERPDDGGEYVRWDRDGDAVAYGPHGSPHWRIPVRKFLPREFVNYFHPLSAGDEEYLDITMSGRDEHFQLTWRDRSVSRVDVQRGTILWTRPAHTTCARAYDSKPQPTARDLVLACQLSAGSFGWGVPEPSRAGLNDLRWRHVGLDPRTGKMVWAGDWSTDPALPWPAPSPDGRSILIQRGGKPTLVDPRGRMTTAPPHRVVWNTTDIPVDPDTQTQWALRVARGVARPESPAGKSAEPTWPIPEHVGLRYQDWRIVAQADGVVAYAAPGS